jgi:hypothetical protein
MPKPWEMNWDGSAATTASAATVDDAPRPWDRQWGSSPPTDENMAAALRTQLAGIPDLAQSLTADLNAPSRPEPPIGLLRRGANAAGRTLGRMAVSAGEILASGSGPDMPSSPEDDAQQIELARARSEMAGSARRKLEEVYHSPPPGQHVGDGGLLSRATAGAKNMAEYVMEIAGSGAPLLATGGVAAEATGSMMAAFMVPGALEGGAHGGVEGAKYGAAYKVLEALPVSRPIKTLMEMGGLFAYTFNQTDGDWRAAIVNALFPVAIKGPDALRGLRRELAAELRGKSPEQAGPIVEAAAQQAPTDARVELLTPEAAVKFVRENPQEAMALVNRDAPPSRGEFRKAGFSGKLAAPERTQFVEWMRTELNKPTETKDIADMGKAVQDGAAEQVVANETAPSARAEAPQTPTQEPKRGQEIQRQGQGQTEWQELPLEQLERLHASNKGAEQRILEEMGLKKFPKSADAINNLEDRATPEQWRVLFGTPDHADAIDLAKATHTRTPQEQAQEVSRLLITLSKSTDLSHPTPGQKDALYALRHAGEYAREQGWNLDAIREESLKKAARFYGNPGDAEYMLRDFIGTRAQEPVTRKEVPSGQKQIEGQGQGQELRLQNEVTASGGTPPPVEAKAPAGETPSGPPDLTSARKAWLTEERVAREMLPFAEQDPHTWAQARDEAIAQGIPDRAIGIAVSLNEKPRALSDTETAGMTLAVARLKRMHREAEQRAGSATDPADIRTADAEATRYEQDYDLLTRAMVEVSGREKGRALNAQKITLNQDYDLVSVLNRAKRKAQDEIKPVVRAKLKRKVDEQEAYQKRVETLQGQIDEMTRQIETGEIKPPKKRAIKAKTKELERLEFERDTLRRDIRQIIAAQEPKSPLRHVADTLGLIRMALTTGEFSYVLRQGFGKATANPLLTAKTAGEAVWATFSPRKAYRMDRETFDPNRRYAPLYKRAGLKLSPPDTPITAAEEIRISPWADRIPVVRAFNRGGRVFLNKIRVDGFDMMASNAPRNGEPTLAEAKQIAEFTNHQTGTVHLGKAEGAADVFNSVFFSPRYLASRFAYISGKSMWPQKGRSNWVRKEIAKQYARTFLAMGAATALAKMGGATIEDDRRSSDWWKWRFGNTRIDPLAGLSQITTFVTRFKTGETKRQSGEIMPLVGKTAYGAPTMDNVMWRFLRTKLAPIPSIAYDLRTGKDVVGEESTLSNELVHLTPITYWDIYKAIQDQGVEKGTAMGILAFFGMGLQTYQSH